MGVRVRRGKATHAPCAGAVAYALNPALVHARRSRMAYGIRTCVQWRNDAPPESRFWHTEERCNYSDALFQRFVSKEQLVRPDAAGSAARLLILVRARTRC